MSTKNQQTFAKLARERRLKEKRERKAEKKAAALAARAELADDGSAPTTEPTNGDGDD
jgi:hypothetical protein